MNRITLDRITDASGNAGYTLQDDNDAETKFIDGTPTDDLELLAFVKKNCGPVGSDLLLFATEFDKGIDINDAFYAYDAIKSILKAQ